MVTFDRCINVFYYPSPTASSVSPTPSYCYPTGCNPYGQGGYPSAPSYPGYPTASPGYPGGSAPFNPASSYSPYADPTAYGPGTAQPWGPNPASSYSPYADPGYGYQDPYGYGTQQPYYPQDPGFSGGFPFDPSGGFGGVFPDPSGGYNIFCPQPPSYPPPAPPQQDFSQYQSILKVMALLMVLKSGAFNELFNPSPEPEPTRPTRPPRPPREPRPVEPTCNREDLLARVIDNFDTLKVAGPNDKDSEFGMEDVDAILANPGQHSANTVRLAQDVYDNRDLVDLADWVKDSSGPGTHDRTSAKFQYIGARDILRDKTKVNNAVDYLTENYERISRNGGNTTVMERSDLEAEVTRLQAGNDADKAIAATLKKAYFQPGSGNKNDFISVLANASGNNASGDQTITMQGLFNMKRIVCRRPEDGAIPRDYEWWCPPGHGGGHGDPHGTSLKDSKGFEYQPAAGTTVNLLEDKGVRINAEMGFWQNHQGQDLTVHKNIYLSFGGDKIKVTGGDDGGAPVITKADGSTVTMTDGQTLDLADGTKVTWNNRTLSFKSSEYDGSIVQTGYGCDINLRVDQTIGNRSDGVRSQGIIGNTANYDIPTWNGSYENPNYNMTTGAGLLEGNLTFADYTIDGNDKWGATRNATLRRFNG
jgi:hypothetical protein